MKMPATSEIILPKIIDLTSTTREIAADATSGQAVYGLKLLYWYDLLVLKLKNPIVWRCPTGVQLKWYNRHVSGNHLEVGVGSGYYLQHARFPVAAPRVALMDLNVNCLYQGYARVPHLKAELFRANILESIHWDRPKFDSICLNFVLHCLPGSMKEKGPAVFGHLRELLNPGGVLFGTTILSEGVKRRWLARKMMKIFNKRKIYCNDRDSLDHLTSAMNALFREVDIQVRGCGALFAGRKA